MYQNWPSRLHQLPFDQGPGGPNSYSSKISCKCTRTDQNAIWRYFALIWLLFTMSMNCVSIIQHSLRLIKIRLLSPIVSSWYLLSFLANKFWFFHSPTPHCGSLTALLKWFDLPTTYLKVRHFPSVLKVIAYYVL